MAENLTWKQTLQSYMDRRLLFIFLMGCSSGFPWVLIGSNMSGWLTDAGLTRAAIGYFGSVFAVYALNFLWAPLVDRVKLPVIGQLGQRKSWILLCQGMILLCTLQIAGLNPADNLMLTSLFALAIATSSATQDIAIDAYRIDTFSSDKSHKMPQGSAMGVIGWWTGYSLPGYLAFINADSMGWNGVYYGMAAIIVLLMVFTLIVAEPKTQREALQQQAEKQHTEVLGSRFAAWLSVTVLEPFLDFVKRNGLKTVLLLLLFVFLFKIGEAFLGRMSVTFYREVGFSNEQIGYYSKLIGWGATIFFTLVGSAFNVKFGVIKGLFIGGVAMAASNLMFAWIASVGPNENLFLATILIDNFTSAFATVAFVSFLTLMTGKAFSATQYALLASLGNFGRTTLASFSGEFADYLNSWPTFFIITALMVIPSLIMLLMIGKRFKRVLGEKSLEQSQ